MDERAPADVSPSSAPAPSKPPVRPSGNAPARPAPAAKQSGSIKETVESILVAFILAFIFRAFVVEAFVIPTGSMAPTLLGAHMRFRCSDCGYSFDGNFSPTPREGTDDLPIPLRSDRTYTVYCPNCGYRIPSTETSRPPVHYGDRILVLKYLYLFQNPARWDVVVFKSPDDVGKYQQNYIKRLVGKPGESVMILDGDVYTASGDAQQVGDFVIQPKPHYVQNALWRIVYDNDFHPRGLTRAAAAGEWEQPWEPSGGSGWNLGEGSDTASATAPAGRIFRFDNSAGSGSIHFDRSRNPSQRALTDWLAYDVEQNPTGTPVSDLKLDLFYRRTAGEGALRLSLSKYDDTFIAEITPTQARLLRRGREGQEVPVGQPASLPARGDRPLHIEFENVDYRVTLRVEGRDLIQTTPADYAPDVAGLLRDFNDQRMPPFPSIEVSAERQTCELSHVSLWRDIYYLNRGNRQSKQPMGEVRAFWASPTRFPDSVMRLGQHEFFVLGDNSLISGDARFWSDPIDLPAEELSVDAGRVPERFMLGKAFFVYWPAGYRPADFSPAIIPNFGDMRFIH